ncbi:hypothetical protein [Actinacidiphila bryophytorum]|uniref:hypothetical protein n=1 Tax=Actinacidiphila bryophytorum TaxID=1436133 RepID=UPI002176A883|nr:hypothetical protein [Actinacidiphila bryophytorum]UWE07542.1 hypothetical protein NYE86_01515 [Actinacidiphila bryophytorum]
MRNGPGRGGPRRLLLRCAALLLAAVAAVTGVATGVATAVAAVTAAGVAFAPPAHSDSAIDTVAKQLRKNPVYVDPRVADQLTPSQAASLADRIKSANKPVFLAVLPAAPEFPAQTVLQDLRSATGVTGLYGVHVGGNFVAGADPQVMSPQAVDNLVGQVLRSSDGNTSAELDSFVNGALPQAKGVGPDSWKSHSGGIDGTGFIVAGAILVAVLAGGWLLLRRRRKAHEEQQRERLRQLRTAVDEDITAYGEELDRLDFRPDDPASDDAMRGDYAQGLDAYERAKALLAAARRPEDVEPVTRTLEEGRFALATLDARRAGKPLPERRPPCFFDPRHGPSVRDVSWTPPGGTARDVPACAADAARIADGESPLTRTVDTAHGPQPYWNAGPAYAPYAGGYFGGGLLPGLLAGTLLGGSLFGPGYGYGDVYPGDGTPAPEGGDYTGSDFDPGDFGGPGGDAGGGFSDPGGGSFG